MTDVKQIDILQVSDPKVEGGVIEVPVEAQLEGARRPDEASLQRRRRGKYVRTAGCSDPNRGSPTTSMKWIRAAASC
jgi:hypothetical protein